MASRVGKKVRLWIWALLVFDAVMMGVVSVVLYVGMNRSDIVYMISPTVYEVLLFMLLYIWGIGMIGGLLNLNQMIGKAQAA
jgi:hypothetical protein